MFKSGSEGRAAQQCAALTRLVSPLLLNITLHGMERAAGVRYHRVGADGAVVAADSPVLVRYADDLVALCRTRDEAEWVKAKLAEWLAVRGLAFNEDKTRVVTFDEGFDFLGFTVRRYHGKLLIKPSTAAIRRIRERLRTEMRSLRGSNAQAVIARLNPIVRGWAAYYRTVVSSAIFTSLDHYLWRLTYKWAKHSHPNKPTRWTIRRYFGLFHKSRRKLPPAGRIRADPRLAIGLLRYAEVSACVGAQGR